MRALWIVVFGALLFLCRPAEASSLKEFESTVCTINKHLSKKEAAIPLAVYGGIHKLTKMYLARLKVIHNHARANRRAAENTEVTLRTVSKLKVASAVAIAAIPFAGIVKRIMKGAEDTSHLPAYQRWFAKWDDVWTVIDLLLKGLALESARTCSDVSILGLKICKEYKGAGRCGVSTRSATTHSEFPSLEPRSQRAQDCSRDSAAASRARLLRLFAAHKRSLDVTSAITGGLSKGLSSVGGGLGVVKRQLSQADAVLTRVQNGLAVFQKALGPINRITGRISAAMNHRICIPYFATVRVKVQTGKSCRKVCVQSALRSECAKRCRAFRREWCCKTRTRSVCKKHREVCTPKFGFRMQTRKYSHCMTPRQIMNGGKVLGQVQKQMDRAVERLFRPLIDQLKKAFPRLRLPSLPTKLLGASVRQMQRFQASLRKATPGALRSSIASFRQLQNGIRSLRGHSPLPARGCVYKGRALKNGQRIKVDRCNHCVCRDGHLACTRARCPAPPQRGPLPGFSRYSGDCPGMDIRAVRGVDVRACSLLCVRDGHCRGFSYSVRERRCVTKRGICPRNRVNRRFGYLFYEYTRRRGAPSAMANVPGFLRYPGDCVGMDLRGFRVPNTRICGVLCVRDRRCRGFSFNPQRRVCILKRGVCPVSRVRRNGYVFFAYRRRRTFPVRFVHLPGFSRYSGDCPGMDLRAFRPFSPQQCARACIVDRRCRGISYSARERRCVTKRGICPRNRVNRRNGYLFYQYLGRRMPTLLPPGSYLRSCRGCRVVRGLLQCSCRTRRGRWRFSRLSARCRFVSNQDGFLRCRR